MTVKSKFQGKSNIDEAICKSVAVDFDSVARQIVVQVQRSFVTIVPDGLRRHVERLESEAIEHLSSKLSECFQHKCMGRQDLASFARREIAVLAIKKAVPRFRAELRLGITPKEYFNRFYRDYFMKCGLPAAAIAVIDGNLHLYLRQAGQYRKLMPDARKPALEGG